MTESLDITTWPRNRVENATYDFGFTVQTDTVDDFDGETADAEISTFIIVDGESSSGPTETVPGGETLDTSVNYGFGEAGNFDVIIKAEINYIEFSGDTTVDETVSDSVTVEILEGEGELAQALQQRAEGYKEAFADRTETLLEDISTDESGEQLDFDTIDFSPYDNPTIAVDSSARFSKHDIIGGTTVRQKIGEDPREFSIDGVCTEPVRRKINELHKAQTCELNSAVTENDGLITCQIASASTDPMDDGGAADMDSGEFLYSFSINLIEITVQ